MKKELESKVFRESIEGQEKVINEIEKKKKGNRKRKSRKRKRNQRN